MNKKEIFDFLNKNSSCYLATVEGNKPHVRGIWMYRADENGIIFHTGKMKNLFGQLQANQNVELCFNNANPDPAQYLQIRVSGVVSLDTEKKLKDEIVIARPFLNSIIAKYGEDSIVVYRVKNLKATLWTFATNLEPKTYIDL